MPPITQHSMVKTGSVGHMDREELESLVSQMRQDSPYAIMLREALADEDAVLTLLSDDSDISPQEAGEILKVSRPHVYKLIDKGLLKSYKVGNRKRIKTADLRDYMQRHEQATKDYITALSSTESEKRELREATSPLTEEEKQQLIELL